MYTISLITGDGIGPELSESVKTIMYKIQKILDIEFSIIEIEAGDKALAKNGTALSDHSINVIKNSDACLKAPVGESAADVIVKLRRKLDLYANVRPSKSYPNMSCLRDDIDMVIIRENTEDLYIGEEYTLDGYGVALRIISENASRRIAKFAFETAKKRDKRVTCVHKSNVLRVTDGIFVKACTDVAKSYPDVRLDQMYVDACAMNLIRKPETFDVIVTTNLFGDILSDESSQVVGGLGMAPSANIGDHFALFEPVHGAAFDIANTNTANPSSFILSVKMMLDWLAHKHNDVRCSEAASRIHNTLYKVVQNGTKTMDIGGNNTTTQFTDMVASGLR